MKDRYKIMFGVLVVLLLFGFVEAYKATVNIDVSDSAGSVISDTAGSSGKSDSEYLSEKFNNILEAEAQNKIMGDFHNEVYRIDELCMNLDTAYCEEATELLKKVGGGVEVSVLVGEFGK